MPPKRRADRTASQPVRSKRNKKEQESDRDEEEKEALDPRTRHETETAQKDYEDEDEDEDEDEEDWEAVDVPEHMEETGSEVDAHETIPVYNDVEIVMEAPRPKSRASAYDREYENGIRQAMHGCHIVLLIAHFLIRNKWCLDKDVQNVCLSFIPPSIVSTFENGTCDLEKGVKQLMKWWKTFFKLDRPGLQTHGFEEYTFLSELGSNIETMQEALAQEHSDESDVIPSALEFVNRLTDERTGSRDLSAQLFVATLRSLSVRTRLVASLQPIDYRVTAQTTSIGTPNTPDATQDDTLGSQEPTKAKVPLRKARAKLVPNPDKVDKDFKLSQAKPGTVWAEYYHPDEARWISLDPIRNLYDKPRAMAPPRMDRRNIMSLVLAFEKRRGVTDVTRRYTPYMSQALRRRDRVLTKREREAGAQPWWDTFYARIERPPSQQETAELDALEAHEPMPTTMQAVRNHPLYVLRRDLKRTEVLIPEAKQVGAIRDEPMFLRSDVREALTAEAWRLRGRRIKGAEQPVKHVPTRAVSMEKKRHQELAKQSGERLYDACYGEWQTEAYVPPPVVDGIVPKERYGKSYSIDMFAPSMLPAGGAHIPIPGIGRLAGKLGIDYAEAVVGFDFKKQRVVPVKEGIVIPIECRELLLQAWEEHETHHANEAFQKQTQEACRRWRRLILSTLIAARVDAEYGRKHEDDAPEGPAFL